MGRKRRKNKKKSVKMSLQQFHESFQEPIKKKNKKIVHQIKSCTNCHNITSGNRCKRCKNSNLYTVKGHVEKKSGELVSLKQTSAMSIINSTEHHQGSKIVRVKANNDIGEIIKQTAKKTITKRPRKRSPIKIRRYSNKTEYCTEEEYQIICDQENRKIQEEYHEERNKYYMNIANKLDNSSSE